MVYLLYIVVGGVQYLLDATAFSFLILITNPEISNVLSRMLGAFAGYFLNGYFTFRDGNGAKISLHGMLRFILIWCLMTAISTLAISSLIPLFSGEWIFSVMVKLFVEAILVILSFTLQKFFVFR